jgi:hypothetical protein
MRELDLELGLLEILLARLIGPKLDAALNIPDS